MEETIQNSNKKGNTTYVRILLAVVLLLGALLVGGAALVIGTIISRLNNPEPPPPAQAEVVIQLPQGQKVLKVETNDDHIIIYTEAAVILLDVKSGEEVKRIILKKGTNRSFR
ncbi:MAG: hypothetical protein HAW64_04395 [Alphaproteobacteria bacterium]|nr:hypothetical protein [Alphaproteobacteria bacterium]